MPTQSKQTCFKYILLTICFIALISYTNTANVTLKFCSVYCQNQSCPNLNSNNCTNCWTGLFTKDNSSGQCVLSNTSGWLEVDTSQQIGGGIQSSIVTNNATCSSNYTYYGHMNSTRNITFSDVNGIDFPHYQIRVVFWLILLDDWPTYDRVTTLLVGTSQTRWVCQKNSTAHQKFCGNGTKEQDYMRVDQTFNHNHSNPYNLTLYTNSSSGRYGVKQLLIFARPCHWACDSCSGGAVNNCYSCSQAISLMKLSGTTCNQSCLSGYGETLAEIVCVKCDVQCVICFQIATNCSQCKATAPNAAFLDTVNSTCNATCPDGYFGNTTTRICDPCDPSCLKCDFNATFCYKCDKASGYAWMDYACYYECPKGTFLNNNDTNCTKCHPYCIQCFNSSTNCSSCTLNNPNKAYLLNLTCYKDCPIYYYGETVDGTDNVCSPCDYSCKICTDDPTPCQACNPNYYLYQDVCGTSCPDGYFTDDPTWSCLDCNIYCVSVIIKMQFANSLNDMVYIDLIFSDEIDFNTFPHKTFQTLTFDDEKHTLDMFIITYQSTGTQSYRITITPKGFIFLYNVTLTCKTMDLPTTVHKSKNNRPFKQQSYGISQKIIWYAIKAPDMTEQEKKVIDKINIAVNQMLKITTKPYIQQIKKTGIIALLFSGAQITSCSVLINDIPAQNMYAGARFWAGMVFFDSPPWQQNSNFTKYLITNSLEQVQSKNRLLQQRRTLFGTNSIQWRFQRTGHTSYFLFDTYPILILLLISWIALLIIYLLKTTRPKIFKAHAGKLYSFIHKIHEISIMYITLNTVLEWTYFLQHSGIIRWLSLGFCFIINVYFLLYELYIYYDMLKYPVAQIGNEKYQYYAIKYGSFLKNIRYEEYDLKKPWSPKYWLRPYNYHILSYYKKLMMILSLPIFYNIQHAQSGVLICIQIAEIVRFCISWPYYRKWRNIFKLFLESVLLLFFISLFAQGFLIHQITLNSTATLQSSIKLFYKFGWIAFALIFIFNFSYLFLAIFDLIMGCRVTNIHCLDQARRVYYYAKLKSYEEQNQYAPLSVVNNWVKLGNLNQRNYQELPDINLRIESITFQKMQNGYFQVSIKKIIEPRMSAEFDFSKQNNIEGTKLSNSFILTKLIDKYYFNLAFTLFEQKNKQYKNDDNHQVISIAIKTFYLTEQSLYKPGEDIQMKNQKNFNQKLEIEMSNGDIKTEKLDKLMKGFPISYENFINLPKISPIITNDS